MTSATIPRAGWLLPGSVSSAGRLSLVDKVAAIGIFLYWVLYENVVFFLPQEFGGDALSGFTVFAKLALPFGLFALAASGSCRILTRGYPVLYLVTFALFLLWMSVPTLSGGSPMEWTKLLPRFVFFFSITVIFSRQPGVIAFVFKLLALYVVFALLQWLAVYATVAYSHPTLLAGSLLFAGPYGLLGNVSSMMHLPGLSFPVVRLSGFWNEPSNAAGSAFAAAFLCRFLHATGHGRLWYVVSWLCLVAGFLAFSNAGYLAMAVAIFCASLGVAGTRRGRHRWRQTAIRVSAIVASGALVLLVAFGRIYVAEEMADSGWARALTGVREVESLAYDPSNGRLDLAARTWEVVLGNPLGIGVQEADNTDDLSASAPLLWLLFAGLPGIVLLFLRETVVVAAAWNGVKRQPQSLAVVLAFVVVMVQHTVYGSWMNPNYFILASIVLLLARPNILIVSDVRSTVRA